MIRPFTVLCLLAACGSGLYLYSEKHRTELLDRDIARVIHAAEAARARTGLLRAEWALLNEPGRLQDMAGRYLTLHPMAPTQFVQLAALSAHLPAPLATPPADDDASDADLVASTGTGTSTGAPESPPQPQGAAGRPADVPASAVADKTDAKPAPKLLAAASPRQHAQHRLAPPDRQDYGVRDGMMARGAPLPLAAPPVGASVFSAMARPMRVVPSRPAIVSAVPSYAPARAYVPAVSRPPGMSAGMSAAMSPGTSYVPSALGGAGSLPPPTPYGR